jgi:dynactin 1
MSDLSLGQVINLLDGRQATVRFIGSTHFAPGDWIGVELDDATGKNDGSVQGERYFDCEHGFGMFIRPSAVSSVVAPREPPRRESRQLSRGTMNGAPAGRSESLSALGATALKRTSGLSATGPKRQSVTASSPSPAPRGASARNIRVWLDFTYKSDIHAHCNLVSDEITYQAIGASFSPVFYRCETSCDEAST